MKIFEIGTGYTSIPAKVAAATEIIIEQLTKSMLKNEIDVTLVDIKTRNRAPNSLPIEEVWVPSIFNKSDVSLGIVHKLKRVVYSIFLTFKLHKLIKKENKKIILHFHNQYNMFFFLKLTPKSLRNKIKIAYTNHSGIWRMDWHKIESEVKKRYFQERKCMQKADFVYVLNKETKNNIINHINVDENRIYIINNGVNTDLYHPLSMNEIDEIKEKYGLTGKKILLQVGSICDNKGQLRSLQNILPLIKEDKNFVFAYVGGVISEEYHNEIKEFVKKNEIEEQVKYFGMMSPGNEINELFNIAQASILSSKYEAFGLVVIESLSTGVPVFIHDNFPFDFGEGCIRYNNDNIVEKIKEQVLYNEEYENIKRMSRQTAVSKYSWNQITLNYIDTWKNLGD